MGRQSRRKRDDVQRGDRLGWYGRPERLADIIATSPISEWRVPVWLQGLSAQKQSLLNRLFQISQEDLWSGCAVIDATNVADYFHAHQNRPLGPDDVPGCRPPFETCLVEFSNRSAGNEEWRMIHPGFLCSLISADSFDSVRDVARELGADNCVEMIPYARTLDQKVLFMGFRIFRLQDDSGEDKGKILIDSLGIPPNPDVGTDFMINLSAIALLTFTFCNSRNVSLSPFDPPADVNCERQRRGLRPFLRYHTINIEPMKRVLRTEGDIEHNGLKKALHIVRGHFKEWTEDKPMFGRPGLHGRFWVPQHTAGSFKQGVVFSDYNVKAPKPQPETAQ